MTRIAWFTAGFAAAAAVLARWAVRHQAVTVTWAKPPTRLGSAGTPAKGNVPNHPSDPGGTVTTDPAHTTMVTSTWPGRGLAPVYQATCSCGWRGARHTDRHFADLGLQFHRDRHRRTP